MVADRTVYVSGCLGLDKTTMQLVPGGAPEQAAKALENLEAVLIAADSGIDKVVKNTIFLKDLNDFGAVNEVYKKSKYYINVKSSAWNRLDFSVCIKCYHVCLLYLFLAFSKDFPARSCFQVARLPMDALVEIECIAMTGDVKTIPV